MYTIYVNVYILYMISSTYTVYTCGLLAACQLGCTVARSLQRWPMLGTPTMTALGSSPMGGIP